MAFDIPNAVAYAVLYSVLAIFSLIAVASMGYFGDMSKNIFTRVLSLKPGTTDTVDHFLSARGSAGTGSIALSFFATSMGAWVFYGATELGANPRLSWLAFCGYAAGVSSPAILIAYIGPIIKKKSPDGAFCTSDFALSRYGRVMQITVAVVAVLYMYVLRKQDQVSFFSSILSN